MHFIADLLIKTEKWGKGYWQIFIFESFLSRGTMLRRRLAPPVIFGKSGRFAGPAQIISRSRHDQEKPENRGADVRPHPCFRVSFGFS
jgi:hypothetical protein